LQAGHPTTATPDSSRVPSILIVLLSEP